MKNKRDGASISYLARQMSPYNTKYITQAYQKATEKPYSHFLCDLRQETNDLLKLRSNIFGDVISIYVDSEDKKYMQKPETDENHTKETDIEKIKIKNSKKEKIKIE
jgi:hypothetical protein